MDRYFVDNGVKIEEFYFVIWGWFVLVNGEGVNIEVFKEDELNWEGWRGLGREVNLIWSNVF